MGNGSHPRNALSEQMVGDFRAVHERRQCGYFPRNGPVVKLCWNAERKTLQPQRPEGTIFTRRFLIIHIQKSQKQGENRSNLMG